MAYRKIIKLLLLLNCSISFAIELTNNTTLHGFGTIGGSYNTNEHFIYRENVFSSVGSQDNFSFATHSKLGLQLDTDITNTLKATIQGVVYKKEPGKLETDLDWTYIKYSPTDYLNFKLGRMRIPFFIFSDSSNINYTNIWTHPPKEAVIASVPFTSYNGFEAEYLFNINEHNLSFQTYIGQGKEQIIGPTKVDTEIKNAYGFSLTDNYGDLKLRASYFKGNLNFKINQLDYLIAQGQALGISSVKNYSLDNLDLTFFGLGFSYQLDNIFLASEYTSVKLNNNIIDDMQGWYISTGYQFGKIMPYITYGNSKQKTAYPVTDIPILPPQYGGSSLRDNFTTITKAFNYSQESISLGVRYDIHKNVALKTQVDRIFYNENKRTMYYRDGTESPKGHLDVFSITLDFVF